MTFNIEEHNRKFPTKVNHLPNEEFYAILYPDSITIPGDERSRTNPGHGYPEHTVNNWRMEVYPTKEEWEAEIRKQSERKYNQKFKAIRAVPAVITTEIKLNINA